MNRQFRAVPNRNYEKLPENRLFGTEIEFDGFLTRTITVKYAQGLVPARYFRNCNPRFLNLGMSILIFMFALKQIQITFSNFVSKKDSTIT